MEGQYFKVGTDAAKSWNNVHRFDVVASRCFRHSFNINKPFERHILRFIELLNCHNLPVRSYILVNMAANVGLSTPRGSGTSGYVQRNLAHLRPRDQIKPYDSSLSSHKQRQPDKSILEHDRKREVEVKVFELRDRLEDEGIEEEEIETQTEALRRKLLKEGESKKAGNGRSLKGHDVHGQAEAKIRQDDRFKRALGIRKDYEEGGHWKRQDEMRAKKEEGGLKVEGERSEKERDEKFGRDRSDRYARD